MGALGVGGGGATETREGEAFWLQALLDNLEGAMCQMRPELKNIHNMSCVRRSLR